MSETIASIFREIEGHLSRLGHGSVRLLRTGIDAATVTRRVPLPVPSDVLELYAVHDGTDHAGNPLGESWFFPLCLFVSAEEAAANYADLRSQTDWPENLFPLFLDHGGGFHAWESGATRASSITRVNQAEGEIDVVYGSLKDMLWTVREAYREGLVSVDRSGFLKLDFKSYGRLAARLNPTIAYWSRLAES